MEKRKPISLERFEVARLASPDKVLGGSGTNGQTVTPKTSIKCRDDQEGDN